MVDLGVLVGVQAADRVLGALVADQIDNRVLVDLGALVAGQSDDRALVDLVAA